MRLLLDTHIFLWYITGDERVSPNVRRAVEDSEAAYLSVVSIWEATIKYQLGKLEDDGRELLRNVIPKTKCAGAPNRRARAGLTARYRLLRR